MTNKINEINISNIKNNNHTTIIPGIMSIIKDNDKHYLCVGNSRYTIDFNDIASTNALKHLITICKNGKDKITNIWSENGKFSGFHALHSSEVLNTPEIRVDVNVFPYVGAGQTDLSIYSNDARISDKNYERLINRYN